MEEYEKEKLLEKINRDSSTIGKQTPKKITVDGEDIMIQEMIFNLTNKEYMNKEEQEMLQDIKQTLRQERNRFISEIEENNVDVEKGEELVSVIIGIERALSALESINKSESIEKQVQKQELLDKKRWREFVKKVKDI